MSKASRNHCNRFQKACNSQISHGPYERCGCTPPTTNTSVMGFIAKTWRRLGKSSDSDHKLGYGALVAIPLITKYF